MRPLLALVGLLAPFGLGVAGLAAAPERVVSMNLCTDQLAMLVAAPDQLISVSDVARDTNASAMAEEAERYPINYGLGEEIYLLEPDLVVAAAGMTPATVAMLRRLGIAVEEFPLATTLDGIRTNLRRMGAVLHQDERAEALVAAFDRRLAVPHGRRLPPQRAALYYANSYSSGTGTLADTIVRAAGYANIGREYGLIGTARLPLEQLVMAEPDLVVLDRPYEGSARAHEVQRHPVVDRLGGRTATAGRYWVCGTPHVAEAVRSLAAAADTVAAPGREQ